MSTFTLVLFPDEARGLAGLSALEGLHREGSVSVAGAALVERDEDGLLLLRKDTGSLLGAGLSAVIARVPSELLEFLARELAPRSSALIAEAGGEWISRIDARIGRLGGRVVREW